MRRNAGRALLVVIVALATPALAMAGMPSVLLTDVAGMRLQALSFFLAGLLVSSALIQFIWNRLRQDFAFLPRLSYGKALGLVVLWGLLFVLVLTMISGARELMTPGAWEKVGKTYRLAEQAPAAPSADAARSDQQRRQKLEDLRDALWRHAETHQGQFPPSPDQSNIPPEKWQVPDPSGMRYLYVAGLKAGQGNLPLAYEPDIFGVTRLVLFTSGAIRPLTSEQLAEARRPEQP